MKYILVALACLAPVSVTASTLLANCDDTPHEVIISNGGTKRTVTLTKFGGEIEEFGPMVTFQLNDKPGGNAKVQPVVTPLSPDEELCIWSGKIRVQRLKTAGNFNGGSFR